jgi:hypothetical protein
MNLADLPRVHQSADPNAAPTGAVKISIVNEIAGLAGFNADLQAALEA